MTKLLVPVILCAFVLGACSTAEEKSAEGRSIRIAILGDTAFGESYHDRLASQGREPVLRTRGYGHMIEVFADYLSDSDFVVANLETPVTDRFPSPFAGRRKYIHYADIEKTPFNLEKYGFDLVSLANNHAFDYGMPGLQQTLDLLGARGIYTCGAGPTEAVAKKPYVRRFEIAEQYLHVAFLCLFEYREEYDRKFDFYAEGEKGGANMLFLPAIRSTVEQLRREYGNLFVIAYPHWGKNYEWATSSQRALARGMIEAGVDLVIGHGAHLLQEIERYRSRWIVYGLGNFVFGAPGRFRKDNMHPYGTMATLMLSPGADAVEKTLRLHPIFTDNRVTGYRSRFVTKAEFEKVRSLLSSRSGSTGQFVDPIRSASDRHGFYLELDVEP